MADRSADWLKQAEADMRHAQHAQRDGDYDWAAFASHQAAEKALKAVLWHQDLDPWGRSLLGLIGGLPESVVADDTVVSRALELEKHFILARYPDAYDAGAPTDIYTAEDAQRAIEHGEAIIAFCRGHISQ
jgi:HEPN domain-containing protein